jgi:hypothetical protein
VRIEEFIKMIRTRFADPQAGIRARDRLNDVPKKTWTSVFALKREMDEQSNIPGHELTDAQLLSIFIRSVPPLIKNKLFSQSQETGMTYDRLSRDAIEYAALSAPAGAYWHRDLVRGFS